MALAFDTLADKLRRLPGLERRCFVFSIGDDMVVVTRVVNGRAEDAWLTSTLPDALEDPIIDALGRDRRAPILVLVDTLEQLYREEQVPGVGLLDQDKVVKRYLGMAFSGTPWRGALFLGKGEGRGRRYLFASLPNTRLIAGWMEFLDKLHNPVTGLHLLALESLPMLEKLTPFAAGQPAEGNRWRVVVGHNATGGFRQIIEKNGQLALTRLTKAPPDSTPPAEVAAMLEKDFKATVSYIKRLGYSVGETLSLAILAPETLAAALNACQWPVTSLTVIPPSEAAARLGLGAVGRPDTAYTDVLHALWFATRSRTLLNLKEKEKADPTEVLNRWVPVATAATAALTLGFIGDWALRLVDLDDTVTRQNQRLERVQATLRDRQAEVAELPYPPHEVRAALALEDELVRDGFPLTVALRRLHEALDQGALVEGLALKPAEPDRVTPLPPNSPEAALIRPRIVSVTIAFPEALATPEEAVAFAHRIAERLGKAFPDHAVTMTRPPLNVGAHQILSGSAGQLGRGGGYSAEYQLVRKAGGG